MMKIVFFLIIATKLSEQKDYQCNSRLPCGCSMNPVSLARIVGGEIAPLNTWSWTVSLKINSNFVCGGSIITDSWIISAAHCFPGGSSVTVIAYAGSSRLWSAGQSRLVSKVILHPNYNSRTFENDIALLQINVPWNLNDPSLSRICLPSINSTEKRVWPPTEASVAAVGWGVLSEGSSSVSDTLRQVSLNIVDYMSRTCFNLISNAQVQMCAGVPNGGKDTCQGDSGGPLMLFNNNTQWILAGLTSSGNGCARPGSSGIYTRVASYESWIKSYVNNSVWVKVDSNSSNFSRKLSLMVVLLSILLS